MDRRAQITLTRAVAGGSSNKRTGRDGDWSEVVDDLPPSRREGSEEQVELVDNHSAYENAHQYKYGGLPNAEGSPARPAASSGGLRLPPPTKEPAGPRPPASESTRLPDAVPKDLFAEAMPRPRLSSASRIVEEPAGPPRVLLAGIGAAAVVLAVVAFFVFQGPPPPPVGMISVVSDPEGAEIIIDGSPSGQVTPAQLFEKEAGRGYLVQVRKAGFAVQPEVRSVTIEGEGDVVTAFFSLVPVRTVEVRTQPDRADIKVDGKPITGRSLVTLPDVKVGSTLRIQAELPGYMPVEIEHEVTSDGAGPETLVLVESLGLTVITEPDGAKVLYGDRELGLTPLYDAPMPKAERFKVRIQKAGYRTVVRTVRMSRDQQLDVRLDEVPLSSLPLRRDERGEARRIDRDLKAARRRATSARLGVTAAEKNLNRVLDDPRSMFDVRARAERAVDRAQTQLINAEDGLVEARAAADRFRARVLARE
ncbi:MAG: PEGA domain-containing protein [Myxococcota bacterium]